MIKDRNIKYKYKTEFQPVATFNTFSAPPGSDMMKDAVSEKELLELGTLGIIACQGLVATNIIRNCFPVPSHWDTGNDIFVRVIWSTPGDGVLVNTFTVSFKEFTFGQAPAAADTALDTVIAADTQASVENDISATTWGKITAGGIAQTTDFLVVDVTLTVDAGVSSPALVGVEWAYLPKLTDGSQVSDLPNPTDA